MLSGDHDAYTYLPRSVSRFFRPAQLKALMESVGYTAVQYRVWTMGTVAFHMRKVTTFSAIAESYRQFKQLFVSIERPLEASF